MRIFIKSIIVLQFCGLLITGCNNSDLEITENYSNEISSENSQQILVEDGYLNFTSKETFNQYFKQIDSVLNDDSSLKSTLDNPLNINGFVSIADKLNGSKLKSDDSSEDEVYSELINELIPVKTLHYLLDTTNRIKVEGEIY